MCVCVVSSVYLPNAYLPAKECRYSLFLQVYLEALSDYHLATSGMSYLLAQSTHSTSTGTLVPQADLHTGLGLSLPALDRVGYYSNIAVSADVRRKRETAFQHWLTWSSRYPITIRPSLITCTPHEMACFLESWRASRMGKRRPTDPIGYLPDIAPSTLRGMASQMSCLCLNSGRRAEGWAPDRKDGNPLNSTVIKNYLSGYEHYCFECTPYVETAAVPMTLDLFLKLMVYLIGEADSAPSPYDEAIILRDAALAAYLWETGQRGKEGGELLITDFSYADVQCTPAWHDLVSGEPRTLDPLLVESSHGTKSRKTKHPGTLELQLQPSEEDGGGFLVSLIPTYARAMAQSGSPLSLYLFKTSLIGKEAFGGDGITGDAYNKRLQKHLKAMEAWSGESTHSLRRGSTQLLRANGASVAQIAEQRLWRRDTTVDLYLHLSRHKARLVTGGQNAAVRSTEPR